MIFRSIWKLLKIEITFLVVLVAVAGFLSVPGAENHLILLVPLVLTGAMASMSSGLFNNLYDRDIDQMMKRTKEREKMIDGKQGYLFALGVAFISLAFVGSWIILNLLTAIFIFLGFCSYLFLYTIFLKRRTTWNIVIGGIAGSFPALAGWSALTGSISLTSIYIAFLVFLWTPTHFWSLAVGSKDDYNAASIPMLPAVTNPEETAKYLTINSSLLVFYTLIPVFFLVTGNGGVFHLGYFYYPMAVVLDLYLVYLTVMQYKSTFSRPFYKKSFMFSNYYLMLLLISICLVIL